MPVFRTLHRLIKDASFAVLIYIMAMIIVVYFYAAALLTYGILKLAYQENKAENETAERRWEDTKRFLWGLFARLVWR